MPHLDGVLDAAYLLCASEAVAAHAAHYPSRAEEYGHERPDFHRAHGPGRHAGDLPAVWLLTGGTGV